MQPGKEDIDKFFKRETSEEDSQKVWKFLKSHPEELEQYLSEDEWLEQGDVKKLPGELTDRMLSKIELSIQVPARKTVVMPRMAIAASITLLILCAALLYQFPVKKEQASVASTPVKEAVVLPYTHTVANYTGKTMMINLEDGSVVELKDKSRLEYSKPLGKHRRDLKLKGEAVFRVAKDKTRPFTVFSGALATTALGTVFQVSAHSEKHIKVHLLEGKVVVKRQEDKADKLEEKYLVPGEELQYSIGKGMKVHPFSEHLKTATAIKVGSTLVTADSIAFKDQKLPEVLEVLSREYNLQIVFTAKKKSRNTFTGRFSKSSDSLEEILTTIAELNHLVLNKQEDGFIITE
ncbi:FecR family protein [Desertivirga brevis]|uniref:FecR family protein n=1 Tax=Desertivirga brevis TaxID=2810310 RepID=UPI001A95D8D3|nr:FecR domain-containing protein [Pedobacter sp. SYSU D00873]